jgi:hypothetical protein
MTIDEAVTKSAENLTIFIVKEALFCNVYEQSAWRFIELIKPYKPIKKRVKKLNMDVVSIGFPKSQSPMQSMQFLIDLQNKIKLVK